MTPAAEQSRSLRYYHSPQARAKRQTPEYREQQRRKRERYKRTPAYRAERERRKLERLRVRVEKALEALAGGDPAMRTCPSCARAVQRRGRSFGDSHALPRPHHCPHGFACAAGHGDVRCAECLAGA